MHKWYRDGRELPVGTAEDTYEILSAVQSDSGTYTCKGQHKEKVLYTGSSNMVALKVNGEAPKPLLTLDSPSGEIFTGDTVTLSCRAGTDPAGWEYLWFKKTQGAALTSTDSSSTDGSSYTIHSAAVSHGGEYWCRAGRGRPAFYTPYSDSLQLSITGEAPKPLLTLDPPSGEIFTGDTVTLSCRVGTDPAGWEYLWFKKTQGAALTSTDGSSYTIHSAAVSHGGEYWCRAGRGRPAFYTPYSDSLQLSITAPPPAVLTLNPAWRKFYPTEKVTLKCEIQSRQTGWSYLWYRDGASMNSVLSRGNEYTILALDQSHRGRYSCRGRIPGRAVYTKMSNDLSLTVDARPQAVLTLETAWTEIFRSDSLTLRCQVEGSSAEWNYTWYRDGRHLPLDPSGDRLTLTAGNNSFSSEYKCRGNRTGQPSYTEISEGFRENNIVLKRKVLVSVASSVLLGLILTVLGCVCLRKKRKLAYKMTPQNDMFLSKPPTEHLCGDLEHFSNEEQSTEAKAACSIELYSILDLKKKTEVLPPKQNPEDLTSFKAGQ
ncbi:Fc receptor-like protein 5 [Anguilla rostrata]|uniref:Fc receptor-like protein 5 n=1 Tax=Anguilla rostrata TaxID=7938 RepID=UPI0030D0E56D